MKAAMVALSVVNTAAAVCVAVGIVVGVIVVCRWAFAPETPAPAPEREYRSIDDIVPSRQSWR